MRYLLLLFLWMSWLTVAPAHARTLAVMPLEKGAGSEAYDGLGLALAGMITTDLAQLESLQLVERGRLDAVLSELELAEGSFLDPSTAQKAGRGVGAELMVLGSYSVVQQTFLMDARVVQVEGGKVLEAVSAQGTVDDFVSVEKDLLEQLTGQLEVQLSGAQRRLILSSAPTESFDAFSQYGGGLDAERRGDFEAARARFEQALVKDPAYEEARSALAALRGRLEAAREADKVAAISDRERALLAGLSAAPDPRTQPRIPDDLITTAKYGVRFHALKLLDRPCQRYEEMLAYARARSWKLSRPGGANSTRVNTKAPLFSELLLQAEAVGMIPVGDRYDTYRTDDLRVSNTSTLWSSGTVFAIGTSQDDLDRDTRDDVLGSLWACFPDEERSSRVRALRGELMKAGLGGEVTDPGTYNVTTEDRLVILDARAQADAGQLSKASWAELDALLARYPTDDKAAGLYPHMWSLNAVEKVAAALERGQRRQRALHGLSPEAFAMTFNALLTPAGDANFRTDEPYCKDTLDLVRGRLAHRRRPPEPLDAARLPARAVFDASSEVSVFVDYGCLRFMTPRVHSREEGRALAAAAADHPVVREDAEDQARCDELVASIRQAGQERNFSADLPLTAQNRALYVLLDRYRRAVVDGCVPEPQAGGVPGPRH